MSADFNEIMPKDMQIVSGKPLPEGVWDNPAPEEFDVYNEFIHVWNTENLSLKDLDSEDPTLSIRSMYYCFHTFYPFRTCGATSTISTLSCRRGPTRTYPPTVIGTEYTVHLNAGNPSGWVYTLCACCLYDDLYTAYESGGLPYVKYYHGCNIGLPHSHGSGTGFGRDTSYHWSRPVYPECDPPSPPSPSCHPPYHCTDSTSGFATLSFGADGIPDGAVITSAILTFPGAYVGLSPPFSSVSVTGFVTCDGWYGEEYGHNSLTTAQGFNVTTTEPGDGSPTTATVDVACLIQEYIDQSDHPGITLSIHGYEGGLFWIGPIDDPFGDPYPVSVTLDIKYILPCISQGTGTAFGTLVTGTISPVSPGDYTGRAGGYTQFEEGCNYPYPPEYQVWDQSPKYGCLCFGVYNSGVMGCFMLFDATIPAGAIINQATLKLGRYQQEIHIWSFINSVTCLSDTHSTYYALPVSAVISARKSTSPQPITSGTDCCSLVRTDSQVNWQLSSAWPEGNWCVGVDGSFTPGGSYSSSPDISCVVQELVDQPGWSGGNHKIMLYVDGLDRTLPQNAYPVSPISGQQGTWDGAWKGAYGPSMTVLWYPKLEIYYTMGPINETMNGGVKVDGSARVWTIHTVSMSGGVRLDDTTPVVSSLPMRGGVLVDGQADAAGRYRLVSICSVVLDGAMQLEPMTYNLEMIGGVILEGLAPNDHSYPMDGGVLVACDSLLYMAYDPWGGIHVDGKPDITSVVNEPPNGVQHGGVLLNGNARVNSQRHFHFVATGGVIVDGTSPAGMTARYNASGGVIVGNELDPSIIGYRFIASLSLLWRINIPIVKDLTLLWGLGKSEMFWYRIVGRGRPGDTCDMIADPCCQKYIMNVHAHTPAELCKKLKKKHFTLPIESVQRFRKPAALGNAFDDWATQQEFLDEFHAQYGDCDELIPIDICKIIECAEFCLYYDFTVAATLDCSYQIAYAYVGTGGVEVCQSPSCSAIVHYTRIVPDFSYEGDGTIVVDGEATCWTSNMQGYGGINVGGESDTEFSRWVFEGNGLIEISGEAGILSTHFTYTGSGVIVVDGVVNVRGGRRFISTGAPALIVAGFYELYRGYYGTGGVSVEEGSADVRASNYDVFTTARVVAGGDALVKPYWEEGHGGLAANGSAAPGFKYQASGGVAISSQGVLVFHQTMDGGIFLGGFSISEASDWKWIPLDFRIYFGGIAIVRAGTFELPPIAAEFIIDIDQMTVVFVEGTTPPDIAEITTVLSQCGCNQIPPRVSITHNLVNYNLLSQFLARNNYSFAKTSVMLYNAPNASWQTNYHYRGLAVGSDTEERWDLTFELQCTSIMGSVDLGRQVWKLAIEVWRSNLITFQDASTRIVVGLLPGVICDINANELDFRVILDTQTESAIIHPDATVYQVTLYDNIGLFKSAYWMSYPDLELSVSQTGVAIPQVRTDLTDLVYV